MKLEKGPHISHVPCSCQKAKENRSLVLLQVIAITFALAILLWSACTEPVNNPSEFYSGPALETMGTN